MVTAAVAICPYSAKLTVGAVAVGVSVTAGSSMRIINTCCPSTCQVAVDWFIVSVSQAICGAPTRLRLLLEMLPPPDYRVLTGAQVRAVIIASLAESVRQGATGVLRELELYAAPWGFSLEEISKPMQLWHGSADKTVPSLHGRTIAERLPHCQARYIEGEGHFSLPIGHMERILEALTEHPS